MRIVVGVDLIGYGKSARIYALGTLDAYCEELHPAVGILPCGQVQDYSSDLALKVLIQARMLRKRHLWVHLTAHA